LRIRLLVFYWFAVFVLKLLLFMDTKY